MSWVYRRPADRQQRRKPVPTLFTSIPYTVVFPNGTGTIASVVDELDTTVDLHLSVDDPPDAPSDSDWINNTELTASVFFLLDDMPVGFDSADEATILVRYRGQEWSGGGLTLYAQLFQSDESTTLSDEVAVTTVTEDGSFDNTAKVHFTGITAGSKTIWDGARVRFRWA